MAKRNGNRKVYGAGGVAALLTGRCFGLAFLKRVLPERE